MWLQEHEDAHEYLQKLQDCIDSHSPEGKEDCKPMGAAMYGTFVQTITCRTVEYESRKVEGFYQLSVEVAVRRSAMKPSSRNCTLFAIGAMYIAQHVIDHNL